MANKKISIAQHIKNFGLICCSIMISLTFAELAIRLFWPMDTGQSWRMSAPHGQPYLVNIPFATIPHKFQNFSTTYSINSFGNRGPEPTNETVQVVFLGDSFTFGLFVDEQDTSVGQVRRIATETYGDGQIGVVNAAIAASGIAEWIAYLQDYGQRLNPNLVIANLNYVSISRGYKHPLFTLDCAQEKLVRKNPPTIDHLSPWPIYKNIYTNNGEREISLFLHLKRWLNDNSQLFVTIHKGYSVIKKFINEYSNSDSLLNSDSSKSRFIKKNNSEQKLDSDTQLPNMPMTSQMINQRELRCFVKASFKALRDATEALGGKLIVIDIGYRWQSPLARELSIDLIALDFLPEILVKLDIPYVDLTNQIYKMNQDGMQLTIPDDGHPTKIGYTAIATGTWPFVKDKIDSLRVMKIDPRRN
jgi:hypothetical protein